MSPTYRDDRDAALARADVLLRENERLRDENDLLRGLVDPRDLDPSHAGSRAALVSAVLLLSTCFGAALLVRDVTASSVVDAPEERAEDAVLDARVTDLAARRALADFAPDASAAARPALTRPADVAAPRPAQTPLQLALTPLLHECFHRPRARVEMLATVTPRGRTDHVYVLAVGNARASRAERRCVRRAFAAVTLPTAHGDFVSYGDAAELHLVLLPSPRPLRRHRG